MKRFLASLSLAFSMFSGGAHAATISLTPDFATPETPYATPEALALVTIKGQRATSVAFTVHTHVVGSEPNGLRNYGLSVGDAVTFSATYQLVPWGGGNLHPFMKVQTQDAHNNGIGYYDNAHFDADAHRLSLVNNATQTAAYTLNGDACGLAAGATLLEFADAANTGCVTFSGGIADYSSLILGGGSVSASYTLAAVPLPAAGMLYGGILLAGLGAAGRRRRPAAA